MKFATIASVATLALSSAALASVAGAVPQDMMSNNMSHGTTMPMPMNDMAPMNTSDPMASNEMMHDNSMMHDNGMMPPK